MIGEQRKNIKIIPFTTTIRYSKHEYNYTGKTGLILLREGEFGIYNNILLSWHLYVCTTIIIMYTCFNL